MTLKGSQTEAHLRSAFAGEAQAGRRHAYFAKQAETDGNERIAQMMRGAAQAGDTNALGHLGHLEHCGEPVTGLPFGDTLSNLRSALAAADHESTLMYPGMAQVAREEGFPEVAAWFDTLAKAAQIRAGELGRALAELEGRG